MCTGVTHWVGTCSATDVAPRTRQSRRMLWRGLLVVPTGLARVALHESHLLTWHDSVMPVPLA
jgi:hypothetical protein